MVTVAVSKLLKCDFDFMQCVTLYISDNFIWPTVSRRSNSIASSNSSLIFLQARSLGVQLTDSPVISTSKQLSFSVGDLELLRATCSPSRVSPFDLGTTASSFGTIERNIPPDSICILRKLHDRPDRSRRDYNPFLPLDNYSSCKLDISWCRVRVACFTDFPICHGL